MGELLLLVALVVIVFVWKDFKKLKSPLNDNIQPRAPYPLVEKSSAPQPLLLKGDGNFSTSMAGAEHHTDALKKAFRAKINAAKKEYVDTGIDIEDGDTEEVNITVTLVLEDTNPHDSNAVAVMVRDNLIGYLPRGIAPLYRDYLQRNGLQGQPCRCKADASIPLHPNGDGWDIALDLPKLK